MAVLRPAALALAAALLWSCGTDGGRGDASAEEGSPAPFKIWSSGFDHMGEIPSKYTVDGENVSPPLSWSGVPDGTKSLALVVEDPDAPGNVWVHWIVYDIPPGAGGLAEGAGNGKAPLPAGAKEGRNDWGRTGYGGPSPPSGRHRYFFVLYALDTVLPDLGAPTKAALERAMKGHVLAKTELVGTYQRKGR